MNLICDGHREGAVLGTPQEAHGPANGPDSGRTARPQRQFRRPTSEPRPARISTPLSTKKGCRRQQIPIVETDFPESILEGRSALQCLGRAQENSGRQCCENPLTPQGSHYRRWSYPLPLAIRLRIAASEGCRCEEEACPQGSVTDEQ